MKSIIDKEDAMIRQPRQKEGLVFDIKRFTVNDGPGIRSTVFLKGCPLACYWCHNPESQSSIPETSTKTLSLGGRIFHENEVTGKLMTSREILEEVGKDRVFYEESGGGVTISGGEPTSQFDFLMELLRELKAAGFHTALDTCGHSEWKKLKLTMNYVDLYLYDLKIMDDELHIKYTGVSNSLILRNLKNLVESCGKIAVRIPVIPGVNDSDDNFNELASFLGSLKTSITEIDLLPYHTSAENKYKRFGKKNFMKHVKSASKETLLNRKCSLEKMGFKVKIGG